MLVFATFVFQVFLVQQGQGVCSVPRGNRTLIGVSGNVNYNISGVKDSCRWFFPTQPIKNDVLFLHVSEMTLTYIDNKSRTRCSGYLTLPERSGHCKEKYFGCFFYKTPDSHCTLEEILQYARNKNLQCSLYLARSLEKLPRYFSMYTNHIKAINWTKSFTLKYEYISCHIQAETTTNFSQTTVVYKNTTGLVQTSPTQSDITTSELPSYPIHDEQGSLPFIVALIVVSGLLLASCIFSAVLFQKYSDVIAPVTRDEPPGSFQPVCTTFPTQFGIATAESLSYPVNDEQGSLPFIIALIVVSAPLLALCVLSAVLFQKYRTKIQSAVSDERENFQSDTREIVVNEIYGQHLVGAMESSSRFEDPAAIYAVPDK